MPHLSFPGFDQCVWMMRRHDPQTQEEGFHLLLHEAAHYVPQLIRTFQAETNHGLRCWLLELIGEARSENAFALLVAQLQSDDVSLQGWAIVGLIKLNTKAARTVLWQARSYTFATNEATLSFHERLHAKTSTDEHF